MLTCCIATTDASASTDHIRATLEALLPSYAIPSRILVVPQIPLTVNGKPDWSAIDELAQHPTGDPAVPPQGMVAEAWRAVLGHDEFGSTDNFFDVGGHSLLMPALKLSLADKGVLVDLVTLFRYPSVAGLTTYLAQATPPADATPSRQVRRHLRRRTRLQGKGHD
jgi:hypothetical protein